MLAQFRSRQLALLIAEQNVKFLVLADQSTRWTMGGSDFPARSRHAGERRIPPRLFRLEVGTAHGSPTRVEDSRRKLEAAADRRTSDAIRAYRVRHCRWSFAPNSNRRLRDASPCDRRRFPRCRRPAAGSRERLHAGPVPAGADASGRLQTAADDAGVQAVQCRRGNATPTSTPIPALRRSASSLAKWRNTRTARRLPSSSWRRASSGCRTRI